MFDEEATLHGFFGAAKKNLTPSGKNRVVITNKRLIMYEDVLVRTADEAVQIDFSKIRNFSIVATCPKLNYSDHGVTLGNFTAELPWDGSKLITEHSGISLRHQAKGIGEALIDPFLSFRITMPNGTFISFSNRPNSESFRKVTSAIQLVVENLVGYDAVLPIGLDGRFTQEAYAILSEMASKRHAEDAARTQMEPGDTPFVKREEISGWLAFFIYVSCCIGSPILNLVALLQHGIPPLLLLIQGLGSISIFPLMGYFLVRKEPYAVPFTRLVLIILLILGILGLAGSIGGVTYPWIGILVWIWYFSTSKKVKSIYGDLREEKVEYPVWFYLGLVYALLCPLFGIIFSIISIISTASNKKSNGLTLSVCVSVLAVATLAYPIYLTLSTPVSGDVSSTCYNYCSEKVGFIGGYYGVYYEPLALAYHCECYYADKRWAGDTYLPGTS